LGRPWRGRRCRRPHSSPPRRNSPIRPDPTGRRHASAPAA
jgi:hypothetical protein